MSPDPWLPAFYCRRCGKKVERIAYAHQFREGVDRVRFILGCHGSVQMVEYDQGKVPKPEARVDVF